MTSTSPLKVHATLCGAVLLTLLHQGMQNYTILPQLASGLNICWYRAKTIIALATPNCPLLPIPMKRTRTFIQRE